MAGPIDAMRKAGRSMVDSAVKGAVGMVSAIKVPKHFAERALEAQEKGLAEDATKDTVKPRPPMKHLHNGKVK